jgi:hypothetical protein
MDFVVLIVLIVVALSAGGANTWQHTRTQGRLGIGKLNAKCPPGGTPLPKNRKPTSTEQKLWGCWTCPKTGCQVDKYGKERAAA